MPGQLRITGPFYTVGGPRSTNDGADLTIDLR
jgi:hypothetical protein